MKLHDIIHCDHYSEDSSLTSLVGYSAVYVTIHCQILEIVALPMIRQNIRHWQLSIISKNVTPSLRTLRKLFIKVVNINSSKMFWWMWQTTTELSRFCVMVLLSQVFSRRRQLNDLSECNDQCLDPTMPQKWSGPNPWTGWKLTPMPMVTSFNQDCYNQIATLHVLDNTRKEEEFWYKLSNQTWNELRPMPAQFVRQIL